VGKLQLDSKKPATVKEDAEFLLLKNYFYSTSDTERIELTDTQLNHSTSQPLNHSTTQPLNHSTTQPLNHSPKDVSYTSLFSNLINISSKN